MQTKVTGLIIPDIHERIGKLKSILEKYPEDIPVYFLGDFFDSWDGFTQNTIDTIIWLDQKIWKKNYHFCWGNHDIHYIHPVNKCSGYNRKTAEKIREIIGVGDIWNKFCLFHWLNVGDKEYLLSHAGLHPNNLHPVLGFDKMGLEEMHDDALWKIKFAHISTPWTEAGRGRGGDAAVGGIYWLDWNREFVPVPGLNQIVGHSPDSEVRQKSTENSTNYCIDTSLNEYFEVAGDRLKVQTSY